MNPWMAVIFVQALTFAVALLATPTKTLEWVSRHKLAIATLNLVAGVGFWAIRLATGTIPLPFT